MLKELTRLGSLVGESKHANGVEDELYEAFDALVAVLANRERPDAERAALLLLSAGQEMYGELDSSGTYSGWADAVEEAERLLGIVPLTNAGK